MNVKLLIDAIVRQTTVLVAQLSTTAGIRAPLAHVADQIFVELVNEIEAQGVGKKVAADMFGMALRSYQKKVARLTESATVRDRTLWEAVLDYVQTNRGATRATILTRFRYDGEQVTAAVLNDLVTSGLVYKTGRGASTIYGITSEEDYAHLVRQDEQSSVSSLAWVHVYRGEATTRDALLSRIRVDDRVMDEAIAKLVADGRIELNDDGDAYQSTNFVVPVGAEVGWEAAVFDHYQALVTSVCKKMQIATRSRRDDRCGGATLSFDVHPGHPHEAEVYATLETVRTLVSATWDKVSNYNKDNPIQDDDAKVKVTFYFGQTWQGGDAADLDSDDEDDS